MLFFYIRHGDPIYDPDQLTPLGRRQAEAIGKRLSLFGIDRIYASSSTRAQQTAQPTCELMKKEMTILDFAHENYAWREMATVRDGRRQWLFQDAASRRLMVSDEMRALGYDWMDHPAFAGYAYRAGMERIEKGTDELLASLGYVNDRKAHWYRAVAPTEERVAFFAHQGFGSLFLSCLLNIPYPQFAAHYEMQHTGLTVIEFKDEDGYVVPRLLTVANDAHLYREGLPMRYNNEISF